MSEIVDVANRFRRQLLQEERAAATQLVRAFGVIWEQLRGDLARVTERIGQAQAAGVDVKESWLFQEARYRALQAHLADEMAVYARMAEGQLLHVQQIGIDLADRQVAASVRAAGVDVTLARLPAEQIARLVGALADGSPLQALLAGLGRVAAEELEAALLNGVALGWNPRKIERAARDVQGKVLSNILRIARTEAIRPYRQYAHDSYRANSDIIDGWYWLSARNERTCASCWAMHGTFHPLSEQLDDHPNGRCTPVPAVKGAKIHIPTGVELFRELAPEKQQAVLGPAKFAAYQDGQIDLANLVARSQSRVWGTTRREASLKEALGG